MRVVVTDAVLESHPGIEEWLWEVACHAKECDPDIKLMGLHVQVRKSRKSDYWCGQAWPTEDTRNYRTKPSSVIVHPAGRVTMSVGEKVSDLDVARLFAHELRHIGQFHRGRKKYGRLTCSPMREEDIECDCIDFEEVVLDSLAHGSSKNQRGKVFNEPMGDD